MSLANLAASGFFIYPPLKKLNGNGQKCPAISNSGDPLL